MCYPAYFPLSPRKLHPHGPLGSGVFSTETVCIPLCECCAPTSTYPNCCTFCKTRRRVWPLHLLLYDPKPYFKPNQALSQFNWKTVKYFRFLTIEKYMGKMLVLLIQIESLSLNEKSYWIWSTISECTQYKIWLAVEILALGQIHTEKNTQEHNLVNVGHGKNECHSYHRESSDEHDGVGNTAIATLRSAFWPFLRAERSPALYFTTHQITLFHFFSHWRVRSGETTTHTL